MTRPRAPFSGAFNPDHYAALIARHERQARRADALARACLMLAGAGMALLAILATTGGIGHLVTPDLMP